MGIHNLARGIKLAEIQVGFDEIIANWQTVDFGHEVRFGELEQFRQMSGIAKVAAYLHEQIRRSRFCDARQGFVVISERLLQVF